MLNPAYRQLPLTGPRCDRLHARCVGPAQKRMAWPCGSIDRAASIACQAKPGETADEVRLFLRSGWHSAFVHGSTNDGPWTDFPMKKVPSSSGKWLSGSIPLSASSPTLEFVIASGTKEHWDKPSCGGNYQISESGTFKLQDGTIQKIEGRPVMVVSDLDGTMVGDDAATAEFKRFWEEEALLRGGVLVYNTGRSLESFLELFQEKKHCLAHPDALISMVGTKVYEFDGSKWHEDMGWTRLLDSDHWNVGVVREAGYKALAMAGKEKMHFRPASELNDHKVTLGVHTDILKDAVALFESELEAGGVKANIITSGHGDWRYLDVVPLNAGKLEALEYVRVQHGFPTSSTVACGDSGNDILMLAGHNPAIVVGNAQADLKHWVDERLKLEPPPPEGSIPRLFVASKFEAHGILEGLECMGFK